MVTREARDAAHHVRNILARERPTLEHAATAKTGRRARAAAHTQSEDLDVLRRHASAWLLKHGTPGRKAEQRAAPPPQPAPPAPRGALQGVAVGVTPKASEIASVRYKEGALKYAAHPPKVVLVSHELGRIIAEQG